MNDKTPSVNEKFGPKSKASSVLSLFDDEALFSLIVSGKVKVLSALLLFDSSVCCLKSTYTLRVFKPSEGVSQFRITGAEPKPPIPCSTTTSSTILDPS